MHDILGHPLEVGTRVLTPPYYGVNFEIVTTIRKVTKKAVYLSFEVYDYDRERKGYAIREHLVRRRPNQMIAVDAQLKYNSIQRRDVHPSGSMVVEVSDDGPGITSAKASSSSSSKGEGVGLSNIRERLQTLYDDYSFTLSGNEPQGLKVNIRIPLEFSAE